MAFPITTVNDTPEPRDRFMADGIQNRWSCDWPVRRADDIIVLFNDGLTPDIAYTFDPATLNTDSGFDIIFASPPQAGTPITVYRRGPLERQANYGQQKAFRADTVNAEFVDMMLRLQELRVRLMRTVRLPESDSSVDMVLPPASSRASALFGFDEQGKPLAIPFSAGGGIGGVQVYDDTTLIAALATRLDFGNNLTASLLGSGRVRIDAAAAPPSETTANAIDWGHHFDLIHDGVTDQAPAITSLLLARAAAGHVYTRLLAPPLATGPLAIRSEAEVPSGHTLDLSQVRQVRGKHGSVAIRGRMAEAPAADLPRLAVAADAGATVVFLDLMNQANEALFPNGVTLHAIGRGMSDANARALQRWEGELEVVDASNPALVECHISPPLPDDEGEWLPVYPPGEYEEATGTPDRTYFTAVSSRKLTVDTVPGGQKITVENVGGFAVGDMCILTDHRLSVDIAGTSQNSIRTEPVMIRRIAGNDIFVWGTIPRDYLVAETARLIKVDAPKDARIICGPIADVDEAPDLPGPRIHYYHLDLAGRGCEIVDAHADERSFQHQHRGQMARMARSYGTHIRGGYRIAKPDALAGSGDAYAFSSYYCSGGWSITGTTDTFCRHGPLAQGSVNGSLRDFRSFSPQVNGFDLHGLDERNIKIHDFEVHGPDWGSAGSDTRSGGTLGNTFHSGGCRGIQIFDGLIVGFRAGDDSSGVGVIVRGNVHDVTSRNVRVVDCDRAWQVNGADRLSPLLGASGIDIEALIERCHVGIGIRGRPPLWSAGHATIGTSARPDHVRSSDGGLWSTTQSGTTGSTPLAGTEGMSDGAITWTYVGPLGTPVDRVRVSGTIEGAARPVVATRVTRLLLDDIEITSSSGPIEIDDCPGFVMRDADIGPRVGDAHWLAVAGDCDGSRVIHPSIDDIAAWTEENEGDVEIAPVDLPPGDDVLFGRQDGEVMAYEVGTGLAIVEGTLVNTGAPAALTYVPQIMELAASDNVVLIENNDAALGAGGAEVQRRLVLLQNSISPSDPVHGELPLDPDLGAEWLILRPAAQTAEATIRGRTTTIVLEATRVNGQPDLTVASVANVNVGNPVSGTGIPAGTVIGDLPDATTITMVDGNGAPVTALSSGTDDIDVTTRWATVDGFVGIVLPAPVGGRPYVATWVACVAKPEGGKPAFMTGERPLIFDSPPAFLASYSERIETLAIDDNAVVLDLSTTSVAELELTQNVDFTFVGDGVAGRYQGCALRVTQDGSGGWSIDWPESGVIFEGGTPPSLEGAPGATTDFLIERRGTGPIGIIAGPRNMEAP